MQLSGSNYFYTRDHLGSIRELTDSSGVIQARYSYDPYGRRTKLSGSMEADFGFTGDYLHAPSHLALTLYRAYNADLGRWISRDPIGEDGGVNLYGYVGNNPLNRIDPLGLDWRQDIAGYVTALGLWLHNLMNPTDPGPQSRPPSSVRQEEEARRKQDKRNAGDRGADGGCPPKAKRAGIPELGPFPPQGLPWMPLSPGFEGGTSVSPGDPEPFGLPDFLMP